MVSHGRRSILNSHLPLLPLVMFLRFCIITSCYYQQSIVFLKLIVCNSMAASLGQVYKGRLKENGDLVAVKVQRPFVLETVTVDLYIIRNLGLVLRKFPQVVFSYKRFRITQLLQILPCFQGVNVVLIVISPPNLHSSC